MRTIATRDKWKGNKEFRTIRVMYVDLDRGVSSQNIKCASASISVFDFEHVSFR